MLKVMIAEDDLMMADMLSDIIVGAGYDVCGLARTVDEGVALGEVHKPDLAVLDLRLASGGLGTQIATRLGRGGGMGVLYATGNANQFKLTSLDGQATLSKPYRADDVVRALEIVEEMVSTGHATPPFPSGFTILPQPANSTAERHGDALGPPVVDVARLLRQRSALAAFGGFALRENDLDKILTEAARVCALSLEVPFSKVCRYRSEENDLIVEAGFGWRQGVVGGVVTRADASSPPGRAFITGKPVVCEEVREDVSFLLPALYAEHGIASTLDVPIQKKEGPGACWKSTTPSGICTASTTSISSPASPMCWRRRSKPPNALSPPSARWTE